MNSDKFYIYGVDDHAPIHVSGNIHNKLVVEDLIHFDGRDWLYFNENAEKINALEKELGK